MHVGLKRGRTLRSHAIFGTFAVVTGFVLAACGSKPKPAEEPEPAPVVSASVSEEPGTVFTPKPVASGDKRELKMTTETKFTLNDGKKDVNVNDTTEAETRKEEVLEAADGAIMKVKVNYAEKNTADRDKAGKEKKKKSDVEGKTYVVSLKDGKVIVKTADEKKDAPKKEAEIVAKDYKTLGKAEPMMAAFPKVKIKNGARVPELEGAFKESLPHEPGDSISDVSVTFEGLDGKNGVFDVVVTLNHSEKVDKTTTLDFKFSLKGKMIFRVADAWPTEVTLEGPIDISVLPPKEGEPKPKTPAAWNGKGTLKQSVSFVYP